MIIIKSLRQLQTAGTDFGSGQAQGRDLGLVGKKDSNQRCSWDFFIKTFLMMGMASSIRSSSSCETLLAMVERMSCRTCGDNMILLAVSSQHRAVGPSYLDGIPELVASVNQCDDIRGTLGPAQTHINYTPRELMK